MRLTYEQINEIKQKYNVDTLWSFSRFDTYRTSQWEYLLKYIKHVPENNDKPSAYASLGTACHDQLEGLYNGSINYEDMTSNFEDLWMTNIEIAGLYFDRNDSIKNSNIANKYYKNLIHFFSNYNKLPYKLDCERHVVIKITDDIIFNGYIDAIYKDNDNFYNIIDFKTSSKYSASALKEHSAQLVLYSEALRQLGVPKEKIKCGFNFLKYVDVDCEQVNGKVKTRTIERHEIGSKLQASVKTWLKKLGYEDQMLEYLDALVQTNDIKCLPKDVQAKYVVNDCYVYVEDIWGFYEKLKEEIIETIEEINEKTIKYKEYIALGDEEAAEKLFWDDDESLKAQSYYYNNLCGYNIPTIKPYKQYLDKINAEKAGDIFGKANKDDFEEDDLSWLNDL